MAGWWSRLKLRRQSDIPQAGDLAIFKNNNFTRLWSAQILSQVAQQLLNFALIVRVFDLAQGTRLANISVALVVLSFGIPSIFFAAAAGVYVDHWNRKIVLVVANIIRGVLALGYIAFEHNLAMVLLLSFLIASTTQFFAPAEAASIPILVGEKQLLRANSLFIFTMYASFIVGYGAASPVIALFGPQAPYYITAIMFLLAGLFVARLPNIRAVKHSAISFKQLIASTFSELRQNGRLIRSNIHLSFPILQLTVSQAIVGVILALAPALSLTILHRQIQHASQFLILPAGVGMVIGVVMIGFLSKRFKKAKIISDGLIAGGVVLSLLGITGIIEHLTRGNHHHVAVSLTVSIAVALLVLVLGMTNGLVSIAAQTLLQEHTTDASRGKVFGALNMMVNIAATLPILFAGILADFFGVTRVITVLGLVLLVFAVVQARWLSRRNFT
jgi:MFS family permease